MSCPITRQGSVRRRPGPGAQGRGPPALVRLLAQVSSVGGTFPHYQGDASPTSAPLSPTLGSPPPRKVTLGGEVGNISLASGCPGPIPALRPCPWEEGGTGLGGGLSPGDMGSGLSMEHYRTCLPEAEVPLASPDPGPLECVIPPCQPWITGGWGRIVPAGSRPQQAPHCSSWHSNTGLRACISDSTPGCAGHLSEKELCGRNDFSVSKCTPCGCPVALLGEGCH